MRRRGQGNGRLNKISGNKSSYLCIQQRGLKKLGNETAEMLLLPLVWSLAPRVVLILQGRREATVMPILAELQERPEDNRLRNPMSVLGIFVEAEYKIGAHLGEGEVWKKSQDSFCREKNKNSLKVSAILWVRMIHLIRAAWISGRQDPSQKGLEESKLSPHRTNVFA